MSLVATDKVTLRGGSALEVLRVFLRLGLTSFGGPVAHLGYFRAGATVLPRIAFHPVNRLSHAGFTVV